MKVSNVISYLAKAHIALSVIMTAISTIFAILLTLMLSALFNGDKIEVSAYRLFLGTVKVVLVPVVLGVMMNKYLPGLTKKILPLAPLVAFMAIVLIVAGIIGQGKNEILNSDLRLVGVIAFLHICGFLFGYSLSKMDSTQIQCRLVKLILFYNFEHTLYRALFRVFLGLIVPFGNIRWPI